MTEQRDRERERQREREREDLTVVSGGNLQSNANPISAPSTSWHVAQPSGADKLHGIVLREPLRRLPERCNAMRADIYMD